MSRRVHHTGFDAGTGSNLDLLRTLAQTMAGTKINTAVKKSNMNNMLMQLRK